MQLLSDPRFIHGLFQRLQNGITGQRHTAFSTGQFQYRRLSGLEYDTAHDWFLQLFFHVIFIQIVKQLLIAFPERRFFLPYHHVFSIMAAVISVGLASSVKQFQQTFPVLLLYPVSSPAAFQIEVGIAPVDFHHSGCVARALHAAFDLHGIDSRFYHIGNEIQRAQIF